AHVTGADGLPPPDAQAWGWRSYGQPSNLQRCGDCIGWVEGPHLYLDPGAALGQAQEQARRQGVNPLPGTLAQSLRDEGMLQEVEPRRFTVRRMLAGTRRGVWSLRAETLVVRADSVPSAPISPNSLEPGEIPWHTRENPVCHSVPAQ